MRLVKISKRDYTSLEKMYIRLNAVYDAGHTKHAFVQHVYWSKKDIDKMHSLVKKELYTKYKHMSKKFRDQVLEGYSLAFCPAEIKGPSKKMDGYMLIDDASIERDIEQYKFEFKKQEDETQTIYLPLLSGIENDNGEKTNEEENQ